MWCKEAHAALLKALTSIPDAAQTSSGEQHSTASLSPTEPHKKHAPDSQMITVTVELYLPCYPAVRFVLSNDAGVRGPFHNLLPPREGGGGGGYAS